MSFISKLYYYLIDYILPLRCLSCPEITGIKNSFCATCWNSLDFIAKPYCLSCGRALDLAILENQICAGCYNNKPSYTMARSLLKFNEHSKKIIHAFKYQDKTALAQSFAKLLYRKYNEDIQTIDLIVPVPMNRWKRLFRMYNPAHILANELAKVTSKPLIPDILIKSKWTKSQTFLSKLEREKNLSDSLQLNTKHQVANQKILLVDDVLTTGTTVNKCTKLLRQGGAHSVYVVTVART